MRTGLDDLCEVKNSPDALCRMLIMIISGISQQMLLDGRDGTCGILLKNPKNKCLWSNKPTDAFDAEHANMGKESTIG